MFPDRQSNTSAARMRSPQPLTRMPRRSGFRYGEQPQLCRRQDFSLLALSDCRTGGLRNAPSSPGRTRTPHSSMNGMLPLFHAREQVEVMHNFSMTVRVSYGWQGTNSSAVRNESLPELMRECQFFQITRYGPPRCSCTAALMLFTVCNVCRATSVSEIFNPYCFSSATTS